ncbi:hypothetical protein INT43_005203, partial [Umbelopsis isabellina]
PMQRQVQPCPNVQNENSRTKEKRAIAGNAFKIEFACYADKQLCQKAGRAFERAGVIISDAFIFKTQIVVNATIVPFCAALRECQKDHIVTLGGSYPARTMAMARDDGVARLYPQALIKQLGYNPHPAYSYFDIISLFNADAPFWFEEDGPIGDYQSDFLFVILHEFMHGLGFYSNWNNNLKEYNDALVPDVSLLLENERFLGINKTSKQITVTSFLESAMDEFIVSLPDMKRTSAITHKMNRLKANHGQSYYDAFHHAGLVKEAKEMYRLGTTRGALGFQAPNDTSVAFVLESNLDPFQPGSSISHVDYEEYGKSPDFLMRFMQDRGVTLQYAMERSQSSSAIGPRLRSVMKALGYHMNDYPSLAPLIPSRLNTTKSSARKTATLLLSHLMYPICTAIYIGSSYVW